MSNTAVNPDERYYVKLEEFLSLVTNPDEYDVEKVMAVLEELCLMLRVSRGVMTFYDSVSREAQRMGEEVVCYDSGEESELASLKRAVSPTGIVATCAVYQAKGAQPFSATERSRVELIQGVLVSVINRSRQVEILNRMAYTDEDGYRNLRYFTNRVVELGRSGKLPGMAAFRINLKHFSLVNQQIGREAANRAMKAFYRELIGAVGEDGCVGRLGGDNFVAICRADCIDRTMECLRGCAVTLHENDGEDDAGDRHSRSRIVISALAGGFEIPEDFTACTVNDVMDRIMSAYQTAKAGKSGDIVFYSEDFDREKERVLRIQRSFERALKKGEFRVYYQPKVNVQTLKLIGAEALCRWVRDGQLVPPSEFIPVLERGTDICRLDFHMLDLVCRDIRRWLDEGLSAVRVSVNLSRRHMMDPDLLQHIIEIIDRHEVPHEYIEIELTETTTDVEFRDLKRVVKGLQAVGICTSVDDFGVGYSSLNLIKEIPWNVLKLDRSLLPDRGNMKRGSQMYRHIVSMAREIGLECVAEGVETREQLQIMRDYGCDIVQGFFFDRPLPVEDFEKRLQGHDY